MKPLRMIPLSIFISVLLFVPAYSHSSPLGDLRINLVVGDVQLKTADTGEWVPAAINTPIEAGDVLWVPEGGKAGMQSRDGSDIRLNGNTSLEVLTLEKNSYQFYLTTGDAYVNFRAWRGSYFQIDTPVSTIRAYDPSVFRVDVSDDGFVRTSVFKGRADVENHEGKTTVNAGKALSLGRDHYAELSPLGPSDAWERWNREKDRRLAETRYSDRYLPEELRPYAPDFEENGRWVYVREYGYV